MSGLEELRRLEAAATRGPWAANDFGHPGDEEPSCIIVHQGKFDWRAIDDGEYVAALPAWDSQEAADAEFIVAARNQLPRILDGLDAVQEVADGFDAEARNANEGARMAAEINDGRQLMLYETERFVWQQAARSIRAAITKALEGKQ